ncbi:MAG: transposase [Prevotellaceae bacterium]|nr:transposase [Prevotellaceae bacterium]
MICTRNKESWKEIKGQTYFGYKNHVKQDGKSKLISKYEVTSAEVHDSNATELLIDENDKGETLHADSAYTGKKQEAIIKSREMENRVCEKGYRNNPLTEQ